MCIDEKMDADKSDDKPADEPEPEKDNKDEDPPKDDKDDRDEDRYAGCVSSSFVGRLSDCWIQA
jgi:hypothetical protein